MSKQPGKLGSRVAAFENQGQAELQKKLDKQNKHIKFYQGLVTFLKEKLPKIRNDNKLQLSNEIHTHLNTQFNAAPLQSQVIESQKLSIKEYTNTPTNLRHNLKKSIQEYGHAQIKLYNDNIKDINDDKALSQEQKNALLKQEREKITEVEKEIDEAPTTKQSVSKRVSKSATRGAKQAFASGEMTLKSQTIATQTSENPIMALYKTQLVNVNTQKSQLEQQSLEQEKVSKSLSDTLKGTQSNLVAQEELQTMIKNLEIVNAQLKRDQKELEHKLPQFTSQTKEESIKIEQLQELERFSANTQQLLEKAEKNNQELRDQLDHATSEADEALKKQEIKLVKANMAKEKAEIEKQESQSRILILNAQVEALTQDAKTSQQSVSNRKALEEEKDALDRSLQENKQKIVELNEQIQGFETEKALYKADLESLKNAQNEIIGFAIEENEKRIDIMTQERGELIDLITTRDKGALDINATLYSHLKEANTKVKVHDANVKEQSEKLNKQSEELIEAQQELTDKIEENIELTNDLQRTRELLWDQTKSLQELSVLRDKITERDETHLDDLSQLTKLETKIEALEQEEKSQSQKLAEAATEQQKLQQKFNNVQSELKNQEALFERAKQEHNDKTQELTDTIHKLESDLSTEAQQGLISREEKQIIQTQSQELELRMSIQASAMDDLQKNYDQKINTIKQDHLKELEHQANLSDARYQVILGETGTRQAIVQEWGAAMQDLTQSLEKGKNKILAKDLNKTRESILKSEEINEKLMIDLAESSKIMASTTKSLNQAITDKESARKELYETRSELDQQEDMISEYKEHITSQDTQLKQLHQKLTKDHTRKQILKNAGRDLENDLANATNHNDLLMQRNSELNQNLETSSKLNQKQSAEMQQMLELVETKGRSDITELEESHRHDLQEMMSSFVALQKKSEESIADIDKRYQDLQNKRALEKEDFAMQIADENRKFNERVKVLEDQYAFMERDSTRARLLLDQRSGEMEVLEQKLDTYQKRREQEIIKIKKAQTEHRLDQGEIKALQDKLSKMDQERIETARQLEALGVERDNQVTTLHNKLEQQQTILKSTKGAMEQLRQQELERSDDVRKKELQQIQQQHQQQISEFTDLYAKALRDHQKTIEGVEEIHNKEINLLQKELDKQKTETQQFVQQKKKITYSDNPKEFIVNDQEVFVMRQGQNEIQQAINQEAKWLDQVENKADKLKHGQEMNLEKAQLSVKDGYEALINGDKERFEAAQLQYMELVKDHPSLKLNSKKQFYTEVYNNNPKEVSDLLGKDVGDIDVLHHNDRYIQEYLNEHNKEESLGIHEMFEQHATQEDKSAQDSLVTVSTNQNKQQLAQDSLITRKSAQEEDEDKLLKAYRNLNVENNKIITNADNPEEFILNPKEMSAVREATTKSYTNISAVIKEIGAETKNLTWEKDGAGKETLNLGHGFKPLSDVSEKTQEFTTGNGVKLTNYRSVDVPKNIDAVGETQVLSLVVKDLNGNNINQEKLDKYPELGKVELVYKKDGSLGEIVCPKPVFKSDSKDPNSPIYTLIDGEVYTLPINKGQYDELNQSLSKGAQHLDLNLDKEKSVTMEKAAGLPEKLKEEAQEIGQRVKKNVQIQRGLQEKTVSQSYPSRHKGDGGRSM